MAEQGITRQQLIAELSRSPHANTSRPKKGEKRPKVEPGQRYKEYATIAAPGAKQHPEFYSRLLSWNLAKGQIKDSRVALPVIALGVEVIVNDRELHENALAHLAALDPRQHVRAMEFAKDLGVHSRTLRRLTERYLRDREADRRAWNRSVVQHRRPMKRLYTRYHVAPGGKPKGESYEWEVLNEVYDQAPVFDSIATLRELPPRTAALAISEHKIPMLIALPALGAKAKDPDAMVELIRSMSATELITSMKLLEKLGVKSHAITRAALDEALGKAKTSKKATLKTTQAAEAMEEIDAQIAAKLRDVQEKQIEAVSTIDGDWVVLGDKSGSMEQSIRFTQEAGAILARSVKNRVIIVFFDSSPHMIDVTGKTYDEILQLTRRVTAGGGTSIGCALNALLVGQIRVDGIALISDGAEHSAPYFVNVYKHYCDFVGKQLPVYFYRVPGEPDTLSAVCNAAGIELTVHDLASDADYYSLPNLIQTMRVNHYSLLDEVMNTPLLKLNDVLARTTNMDVIKQAPVHA